MRRHQYIGLFLLLAGAGIAFGPWFLGKKQEPRTAIGRDIEKDHGRQVASTPDSLAPSLPQPVAPRPATTLSSGTTTQVIQTANGAYIDSITRRALREAEAAAQRASRSFRKEMMAPLESNDRSFAEKLYSIVANAKAISKNESEYRDYVSKRFYEELTNGMDIQKNLDAVAFEYLNRLDRIANQTLLDSGLDVTNMPPVTLTIKDFDNLLRAEIRESVGQTTSTMQLRSRQGMAVQTVSLGIGLLMPTTFLVDLAIGIGIDTTANTFRDPVGDVAIDAHKAAEQLADRICFGSEQHQGLYAALLDIAQYQNNQLHAALSQSDATSKPENLDAVFFDKPGRAVFGENHE